MNDLLNLDGWRVASLRREGSEYLFDADYTVQPTTCTKCGAIGRHYKHGPKAVGYRDSPMMGKPVSLLANVQRYRCRECGGTYLQPLAGIREDTRMTERCASFITDQCLRDTFQRISHNVGCDPKTVRTVAAGHIHALNSEYKPCLPNWLGIGETQIDGRLRCIITDVVNRVPIDMLRTRDKKALMAWLHQFKNGCTVKGIVIDMWLPYKVAVQSVLPGLPVIIEKFRMVTMANQAMDDVCISLARDDAKAVGKDWTWRKTLLQMPYKNLDEKGRLDLRICLDNEPGVAAAYRLKEAFCDIYYARAKTDAAKRLDAWCDSVPVNMKKGKKSFAPLLAAIRKWRTEILAYFDHPISHGYSEALNGVANAINKQGRGYSFEVLRARLLFGRKPLKAPKTIPEEDSAGRIDIDEPKLFQLDNPRVARANQRKALLAQFPHRCQSCGGVFDAKELQVHVLPLALTRETKLNAALICSNCHIRFHTNAAIQDDSVTAHQPFKPRKTRQKPFVTDRRNGATDVRRNGATNR